MLKFHVYLHFPIICADVKNLSPIDRYQPLQLLLFKIISGIRRPCDERVQSIISIQGHIDIIQRCSPNSVGVPSIKIQQFHNCLTIMMEITMPGVIVFILKQAP